MSGEVDINEAIKRATEYAEEEIKIRYRDPDRKVMVINREWHRLRDKRIAEYMGW